MLDDIKMQPPVKSTNVHRFNYIIKEIINNNTTQPRFELLMCLSLADINSVTPLVKNYTFKTADNLLLHYYTIAVATNKQYLIDLAEFIIINKSLKLAFAKCKNTLYQIDRLIDGTTTHVVSNWYDNYEFLDKC